MLLEQSLKIVGTDWIKNVSSITEIAGLILLGYTVKTEDII
jgi:hypothetical protein